MIIALLALAFAMILGGLLTAFLGWDIVLVERGWTMVIAGSVSAASGALLLGITAAVSKLSHIATQLSRLQGSMGAVDLDTTGLTGSSLTDLSGSFPRAAAVGAAGAADEVEAQPTLPLFAEDERRERDTEIGIAPEPAETIRADEPVLPFPPRTSPDHSRDRDEEDADLKVPDFLLTERTRHEAVEPRVFDAGSDLHASEPEPRGTDDRDDLLEAFEEPEPDREPEPQPVDSSADEENLPEDRSFEEPRAPAVVGTYNSGDNRYVMFSDGSIEAETPGGTFRFRSLDELKEFIAKGGEGNTTSI